ncbi:MAG: hypothetical protein VW405_02835 [Rhodospirillaceae bacterium]
MDRRHITVREVLSETREHLMVIAKEDALSNDDTTLKIAALAAALATVTAVVIALDMSLGGGLLDAPASSPAGES